MKKHPTQVGHSTQGIVPGSRAEVEEIAPLESSVDRFERTLAEAFGTGSTPNEAALLNAFMRAVGEVVGEATGNGDREGPLAGSCSEASRLDGVNVVDKVRAL